MDAGAPVADAMPTGVYVPLLTAEWSLAPGDEGYICATKTLGEDIYIGAIRPIGPPGTHHTVVSLGNPQGPDDPGSPCGPNFGDFYASGAGTQELVLPEGVGLVAKQGQQLRLNLHLFNAGDSGLSGTSGIEVKLLDHAQVQHEASIEFYGPFGFQIPATGTPYQFSQQDTLTAGRTLIAIFPHMHQQGTHFKAELVRGGAATAIWDDAYQFESQEFALITPVAVQPGDMLDTTCTWVNTTGQPISWGDSSKAEMCFSIVMSY